MFHTEGDADIVVDYLRLEVVYDFIRHGSSKAELTVQTSNGELLPYIVLDQEDRNRRQDGQGGFYRSFTQGDSVRLTAPVWYGPWKFDQWVVNTSQQAVKAALDVALSGNQLIAAQEMGSFYTNPVLDITLSGDHVVTAQYHYESEPDFDKDGMPDWWEEVYLGSTLAKGGDDDDGDGLSNYQEYLQGTNPKQTRHRLRWIKRSRRTDRGDLSDQQRLLSAPGGFDEECFRFDRTDHSVAQR